MSSRNAISRANRKLISMGTQTDAIETADIGDAMATKNLPNGKVKL